MSKKYKVIWVATAENDLVSIIEYIANDSSSHALKVLKRIKEKASSLHRSTERGRIIPELEEFGILQYRELIVSPWRIFYRISEKNVYVLSVLDSRRNVEDVLFKKLIDLNM